MKRKIIIAIIIAFICLAIGFLLGRSMSKTITKTEYITDKPIFGTISSIAPVKEEKPLNPILPILRDTVYINNIRYITEKVDSAAIIADYVLKRTYEMSFFDNQYGKLDVSFNTQYNKSDSVRWRLIPIRTVQTITTERVWMPYISVSYFKGNNIGFVGVGGGVFYKKLGVEYQYMRSLNEDNESGNMFNVKYRF